MKFFISLMLIVMCSSIYAAWTEADEAEWKKYKLLVENLPREFENLENFAGTKEQLEAAKKSVAQKKLLYEDAKKKFKELDARRYEEKEGKKIDQLFDARIAAQQKAEEKKDPKTYFIAAKESYEAGDYGDAMEKIDQVLIIDPRYPGADSFRMKVNIAIYWKNWNWLVYFGVIALIVGKIWGFIQKRRREAPQKYRNKMKEQGRSQTRSAQWDEVIKTYTELRTSPYAFDFSLPEKLEMHVNMAKAYFNKKAYTSAMKESKEAVALAPHNNEARDILIESYLFTDTRTEEAIREFKSYLKKKPKHQKIIDILCEEFLRNKIVTQEAYEIYAKKLLNDPKNEEINVMIAVKNLRENNTDRDAVSSYEIAYQQKPDDENMLFQLIRTYYVNKMWEKIMPHLEKLIIKKPDDLEIHKMVADTFENSGKISEIKSFYEKIDAIIPGNSKVKQILEKYNSKSASPVSAPTAAAPQKPGGFKICPLCSHLNMNDTGFCEGCGKPLK